MSTLTKILVVLLTIMSIFLCGILVTYVTIADDYKAKLDTSEKAKRDAIQNAKNAEMAKQKTIDDAEQAKMKLNDEIAALNTKLLKVNTDLTDSKRDLNQAQENQKRWQAIAENAIKGNETTTSLVEETLKQKVDLEAELVAVKKELDETTRELIEKLAVIEDLEQVRYRLTEEKTELQDALNKYLRPSGRVVRTSSPVVPDTDTAVSVAAPQPPVAAITRPMDLKGLIKNVDQASSMASVSIGQSSGVLKGMVFFVTRGDDFICKITITDVRPEEAVGKLSLLQGPLPVKGDKISTNLLD